VTVPRSELTMTFRDIQKKDNVALLGKEAYDLATRLYPICRSITGDGVRQTLQILREIIPITIHEVPTGTCVFDWSVPKEWNIRGASIKNSHGEKVIDFRDCNLHVVNYSAPVNKRVSLKELKEHTFTLPDHPDWIPYRTSYFKENWGFCLKHAQLQALPEGEYDVKIDSSLRDGHLTYGEYFVKGSTDEEVLISAHVCHPSLANDNLAGNAIAALLARAIGQSSMKYSYRFLFIPGTVGSITWLSLNESRVGQIRHGLVLACAGDPGNVTYKKTRRGNAEIDRAVAQVLKDSGHPHKTVDFSPYGYDERQYCSPGFDLPVGCFMRTPHGQYPEYHTSADNLDLVRPESISDSLLKCAMVFDLLEANKTYLNQNPKCEPQLGRRGLYNAIGGHTDGKIRELAMLWVLNLSDGSNSLLDIAERSKLPFSLLRDATNDLCDHDLLKEADPSVSRS
jgi:aminopeptidase-like protein